MAPIAGSFFTILRSGERLTACTGVLRIGVIDRESLALNGVREVDGCACEIGNAHTINNNLNTIEITDSVTIEQTIVEVQLVNQARAASGLNGDTQTEIVAAFLLKKALDLLSVRMTSWVAVSVVFSDMLLL